MLQENKIDTALVNKYLGQYSPEQIDLVKSHVRKRLESKQSNPRLNIVYDVLYECNLFCKGCGVNSILVNQSTPLSLDQLNPTTKDIFYVLDKINRYTQKFNKKVFINFGGGEPFLRPDLNEIVKKAHSLFGHNSVGIDTNGTIDGEFERILDLSPYISYLGVSLDGLEEYHNWWRGCGPSKNAFKKSVSLIEKITSDSDLNSKFEVSSVATKKNIDQIPTLIDFLQSIGVKKYSVHRAMAVGRMEHFPRLIPNSEEYFDLLVKIVEKAHTLDMDLHLHHSIESIYATILLGLNTYSANKIGNPDLGSSLGIEPHGTVVFDPWCVRGTWQKLQSYSLLDKNIELEMILDSKDGTLLDLTKFYSSCNVRCNGCKHPCSGGSRIAAAVNHLTKNTKKLSDLTESHLLSGMTEVDPACPLYKESDND
jgi:MoaA/NifB/PqqE/SkfB family radical SAM enzyme